jgi:hypothetical protein
MLWCAGDTVVWGDAVICGSWLENLPRPHQKVASAASVDDVPRLAQAQGAHKPPLAQPYRLEQQLGSDGRRLALGGRQAASPLRRAALGGRR